MSSVQDNHGQSHIQCSGKEVLVDRLRDAGISLRRFVDLPEGTKQNDHDHTDPANHCPPDDVEGNFAVICGNGLLVIDVDLHSPSFEGVPPALYDLPPTLTVQTPHGGEHRYYAITGDARGTRFPGIDVQGRGQYVVGPGSTLNQCSKEWHDCSVATEGDYEVLHDRPIAEVERTVVDHLQPDNGSEGHCDTATTPEPPVQEIQDPVDLGLAIGCLDTDYPTFSVFRRMTESEKWDRTWHLVQGNYAQAGFPGDRSGAESALVEEFGWWYDDDVEIVWTIVDWICRLNPQTDTGENRKWLERDDEWRQTLFPPWFGNRETYDPGQIGKPGESRPTFSALTKKFVTEALYDLQEATTKEIVAHPRVDRGERQVLRVLDELEEEGVLGWRKRGRTTYYHIHGSSLSAE